MPLAITHAKVNAVASWTQTELDAAIAAGQYAPGTTIAQIVLAQDWNSNHTLSSGAATSGWVLTADGAGGADFVAPSGGGSGTVTSVSVVTANGVSGSVATATTTPTITLTLGDITPTSVNIGTLGYSDTGILQSATSSVAGYNQIIIRNTSNGTSASSNLVVNNDVSTGSTFYGEIGMNSSTFTGTGSLNKASAVYLNAVSGDLVLGTQTANAIRFVTNNAATDALVISNAGVATFGSTVTANISGNAGTATALATARAIGIGGTTGLTATGVNFDGSAAINPALTGTLVVANGGTGATTAANARVNLGVSKAGLSFFFPSTSATNGTYVLKSSARVAGTINSIKNLKTSSGTVTASIQINGTNVTGLASLSVTSTPQSPNASAANTFAIGDRITLVLASGASPADLEAELEITI